MDYPRPVQTTYAGPELAAEMTAALSSASILFKQNNPTYSIKLIKASESLFAFARDTRKRRPYSRGNPWVDPYYNSTGYFDEYLWGSTWLYLATGNVKYLALATNPGITKNAMGFRWTRKMSVLSWDNKVPSALMLLTRVRLFKAPEYPYEETLIGHHKFIALSMCSYLKPFRLLKWSKGTEFRSFHLKNLLHELNQTSCSCEFELPYLNLTILKLIFIRGCLVMIYERFGKKESFLK